VSVTPAAERRPLGAREIIELVALVVAPATLLGFLVYYFGWRRSHAQAAYFGIDSDVLGRSTHEYALRSIGSIFWPLVFILVGVLAAGAVHAFTASVVTGNRVPRPVLAAVPAVVGFGLLVFAGTAVLWRPIAGSGAIRTPVAFALGIPIAAYALFLAWSREASGLRPIPRGPLLLIAGLVVVFLFWAVGDYADARGRDLASRTAENLSSLPSATVYSPQRLHLEGPGIEETRLEGPDSAYRYRYSGLKLLARAGTNYFLLPAGWTRTEGVTIVLPATDTVRVDFAPAR
jgi:hypothetical protein